MQGQTHILAASGGSNSLGLLLPLIIMVGLFYFILIRPQRARQRQQQEMQKTMEPGTRVLTTSGMYATVVEVTDDGVVLEIAPGVEAEFVPQAIMRVVPDEEPEAEEPEEDAEISAAAEEPAAEGSEDVTPAAKAADAADEDEDEAKEEVAAEAEKKTSA